MQRPHKQTSAWAASARPRTEVRVCTMESPQSGLHRGSTLAGFSRLRRSDIALGAFAYSAGRQATTLASNQGGAFALALDATRVYWGNQSSGEIMGVSK